MKTKISLIVLLLCSITAGYAQKQDTVVIPLARTSKIIFTIEDKADLQILKHYNFQELFQDVLRKLEQRYIAVSGEAPTEMEDDKDENPAPEEDVWTDRGGNDDRHRQDDNDDDDDDNDNDNDNDDDNWHIYTGSRKWGRTWQSFNFDLGTNNLLENGKFPDANNQLYSVRPWGSWYVAVSSIQRSRLAKKLFLEWGLGVSWYNFKFQNDRVRIEKTDDGVVFSEDTRDANFIKSKLTASFLQASLIPVIDFSGRSNKKRMWDYHGNSFRLGFGPYVGYRIGSHSKLVYNDGGREKAKERDNFYLNNFRYGARLQLGYRSTDLFFNYDLNDLFSEGKGPKVNAFSFGVIF